MRIVVVGANGQVASDVTRMLASLPRVEVRPVARTRGGSAFLRYQGIPVLHGDISDPEQAKCLLDGAGIVANFALASGNPAEALARNTAIIRQTFLSSPPDATVVFFSTLSVHGQYDEQGRRAQTFYGKMKLKNEALVTTLAKDHRRKAYIFRLGQVAGEFQGITDLMRRDISAGPVLMIDPERASNITFTEMITEALLVIANGKPGPPGLYDLVNLPQWSWRDVYSHEAQKLGKALEIICVLQNLDNGLSLRNTAVKLVNKLGLKELILRGASLLPGKFNATLKADYYVTRARNEIRELSSSQSPSNQAMYWPEIPVEYMIGLRSTQELIDTDAFPIRTGERQRWPADLAS